MTLYLFIFYSSASYSAFFRTINLDDLSGNAISSSIFYSKALRDAWQDSWTTLGLVLLVPAIFLGLGFLLHLNQEKSGWSAKLGVAALIAVTFVFDALLAYEITEKLYNLSMSNNFNGSGVEYSWSLAFGSPSFWIIIFSGFIVYIIWGFLLAAVLKAWHDRDAASREIRELAKQNKTLQTEIEEKKVEISALELQITSFRGDINILETEISTHYWTDSHKIKDCLNDFFQGWLRYVAQLQPPHNSTQPHQNEFDEVYATL